MLLLDQFECHAILLDNDNTLGAVDIADAAARQIVGGVGFVDVERRVEAWIADASDTSRCRTLLALDGYVAYFPCSGNRCVASVMEGKLYLLASVLAEVDIARVDKYPIATCRPVDVVDFCSSAIATYLNTETCLRRLVVVYGMVEVKLY